jgi:hypothetical protein
LDSTNYPIDHYGAIQYLNPGIGADQFHPIHAIFPAGDNYFCFAAMMIGDQNLIPNLIRHEF